MDSKDYVDVDINFLSLAESCKNKAPCEYWTLSTSKGLSLLILWWLLSSNFRVVIYLDLCSLAQDQKYGALSEELNLLFRHNWFMRLAC